MVPLPPERWYNFKRYYRIPDGGIYARPGELVVCENPNETHVICEVAKTVRKGDARSLPGVLINWQQPEPEPGSGTVQLCSRCRARWAQDVFLHFQDGWRI